jgi:hypothetical protein
VAETLNLTEVSGLEGVSRPGWFIPESELPPIPTAAPSVPGSGGASPAGGSPSVAP